MLRQAQHEEGCAFRDVQLLLILSLSKDGEAPLSLRSVPRESGDPDEGQPAVWSRNFWVPACAGNTGFGDRLPLPMLRQAQHEEDLAFRNVPLLLILSLSKDGEPPLSLPRVPREGGDPDEG
jgi:hypothetical protein